MFQKIFSRFTAGLRFFGFFFLARAVAVVFMLCYVYAGITAFSALVRSEINSRADISAFATVIDTSADAGAPVVWARLRPLSDTARMIEILIPRSGKVGPDMFIEVARREVQSGHAEEALFWIQLSKYRLRYDILRCGQESLIGRIDSLLEAVTPKDLHALLNTRPDLLESSLRRVLDFDAAHPPTVLPDHICRALAKLNDVETVSVPAADWKGIRDSLRRAAEEFLSK